MPAATLPEVSISRAVQRLEARGLVERRAAAYWPLDRAEAH